MSQETKFGVYYWRRIGTTGPIKIGKWSGSPEKTIGQYEQRGDPRPAELLGVEYCDSHESALDLEKLRHKLFAEMRIRGEWFNDGGDLMLYLDQLRNGEQPKEITLRPPHISKLNKENLKVSALTPEQPKPVLSERKEFRISGLRWPK